MAGQDLMQNQRSQYVKGDWSALKELASVPKALPILSDNRGARGLNSTLTHPPMSPDHANDR
jgi:hypothetical protein